MAVNQQIVQKFEQQRQKKLTELQTRKDIVTLNRDLEQKNFGGSVSEFNKFYSNLKRSNPLLASRLKYTPKNINSVIDKRKQEIQTEIDKVNKQIKKTSGNRKDTFKAQRSGLNEGLKELNKGNLVSVDRVKSYARSLRKETEKGQKLISFNKSKISSIEKNITPQIVNLDAFLKKQAKDYNKLNLQQKKDKFNKLSEKYGRGVAQAVFNSAESLRRVGKIDTKTIESIQKLQDSKKGGKVVGGTLIDDIYRQQVNSDLIVQGEKPLSPTATINTFIKREQKLKEQIKNNQTKFLKNMRNFVRIDTNFSNKSFNSLSNQEKNQLEQKFIQGRVTVTPKEVQLYQRLIQEKNKNITKNQLQAKELRKIARLSVERLKKLRGLKVSNIKEIGSEIKAKSKRGLEIVKGIDAQTLKRLVVSKQTENAFNKAKKGNFKDISLRESIGVGVDIVGIIPIGKAAKIGGTAIKGLFKNKVKGQSIKRTNKLQPRSTVRNYVSFATSIVNNAGTGLRVYQATQEALKVDNKYLSSQAKSIGLKSEKALYDSYLASVQAQFGDKTIKLEDLSKFLGADLASNKSIAKGQAQFKNDLKSKGLSDKDIIKIIKNLENKRLARVVGQIVGAISIEVSSERLASKLVQSGVKKSKAVGIAGTREFFGVLAQEAYVQDNNITPTDFAGALLFGASFTASPLASQFFSKAKYKKLTKKQIDKARDKLANKFNNKISESKRNKYVNKFLKKQKSPLKAKDLSKKEVKQISKLYIKNSLAKFRDKKTIRAKEKVILRDPIANIADPYEIVGDLTYDLSRVLKKKILKQKVSKKIKRTKVKTIGKSISKAVSKVTGKSKAKTKTKTKTKAKTKTKTKTKVKTKTKTKTKAKTKTKTKTKAKTKTKTKTKTKVKTILLPRLPKKKTTKKVPLKTVYSLQYKRNNKNVRSRGEFPLNEALRRAKSLNKKEVSLIKSSKKKVKDIAKPILNNYQIKRLTNKIKLIKK